MYRRKAAGGVHASGEKDRVTSVVLADDHVVVRQGIKALLESNSDFHVVGEASDGLEAIQVTERLRPDVLVLDIGLDKIDGIEVTRQLARRAQNTSVVILSMRAEETYVIEALRAGAKGYVLKGADADELLKAVREAAVGHRYLSSLLSQQAIENYARTDSSSSGGYDRLTPREREVVYLVAAGYNNASIAEQLYISRRTVEVHRSRAMQKLGVNSVTGLIRAAVDRGLLKEEEQVSEPSKNGPDGGEM
jgi:DNA-binding NarL/FixJ family response regulator